MNDSERWLRLTATAPELDEEPDVWVNVARVVLIQARRDLNGDGRYTVLRYGPDTDNGDYEILVAETPEQILAGVSVRWPRALALAAARRREEDGK